MLKPTFKNESVIMAVPSPLLTFISALLPGGICGIWQIVSRKGFSEFEKPQLGVRTRTLIDLAVAVVGMNNLIVCARLLYQIENRFVLQRSLQFPHIAHSLTLMRDSESEWSHKETVMNTSR